MALALNKDLGASISAFLIGLGLLGCAADAPRGPAVERNLAALATVAPPASAEELRTDTTGNHAPDTSEGPIVSWTTSRDSVLRRPERSSVLVGQVDRVLRRAGWTLGAGGGFYRNARRGPSCMHVLTSSVPPPPDDATPPTTTASTAPEPVADPADEVARGISLIVTDC